MRGPARLLALILALAPGLALAAPQRIVSMNVCTDQLLMMLVAPGRIASLSYLSTDPRLSVMAEEAKAIAKNHGRAEEILAQKPDLVVTGLYSGTAARNLLARLGYKVLALPTATSISGFRDNLTRLARAVGAEAKAREILADFDRRLAALTAQVKPRHLLMADYQANGITSGQGTLTDDVARLAGFTLLGDRLGIVGAGPLPLERLMVSRPDVVVLARTPEKAPALAGRLFTHPAFTQFLKGRTVITLPERLVTCGTPAVLDALALFIGAAEAAS